MLDINIKLISTQLRKAFNSIKSNISRNAKVRKLVVSFASFAIVVTVVATVLGVSNLTYALGVSVNGNSCGFVRDEQEASDAIGNFLSRIVVANGDIVDEPDVKITPTVVPADTIISSGELTNKIVEKSPEYITATTVFVNGELFARADSAAVIERFIISEIGDNELYNSIELRESVMSPSSYDMLPDFSEVCYAEVPAVVNYHVTEQTNASDIKNAYSVLDTMQVAPESFIAGTVIRISTTLPALAVKKVSEFSVKQSVSAYETGSKAGTVVRTMRTYSVAGVEYMTDEVSSEFTEKYPDKPIATEIVDAGKQGFCWPVDTGFTQYTSSYWGDDRGHKGYDIACKTGTPILAVADGYVESVNSSGSGYGLHFIIKHSNGLRTLYSHCSKLYVSKGDKITRGEVVALVGTSGNVTGSHLHFEVRKGNTPVNPMNYIGKR